MADGVALLYLEADDEITTVVRRVRATDDRRVVVVAPGRARATSSVVALRLLARVAGDEGREVGIVGDALTRSLAVEAGLPAYLSVDDARRSAAVDPDASAPRRAGIHVVRGPDEDTGAIAAAGGAVSEPDRATAETTAVQRPPRSDAGQRAVRRRSRWRTAVALAVLLLLLGTGAAVAFVALPSATVTVEPLTVHVAERTYEIPVTEFDVRRGDVTARVTVRATGTYPMLEPARGAVTFSNFSGDPVFVPVGTLVAAQLQAFETVVPITVPGGSLDSEGRVQPGVESVEVVAAAPGPAGNVAATAIDTVLTPSVASDLRGFENNQKRIVSNAAPTTGGAEDVGDEITQADVDRALRALEDALVAAIEDEIAAPGTLVVPVGDPAAPEVEGASDLVGTRDTPSTEINGSMAYDVRVVALDAIQEAAADRLAADADATPPGFVVDPDSVEIGTATGTIDAETLSVSVAVTARAVRAVDEDAVRERVRGLERDAAEAALSDVATEATIEVWPAWLNTVPAFDWRIEVRVAAPDPRPGAPSPSPSPSPSQSP